MRALASTLLVSALVLATSALVSLARADDMQTLLRQRGLLEPLPPGQPAPLPQASELAVHAMGHLGVPYKWGGNMAETGLDCSGFVRAVYQQITGIELPRSSDQQAAATRPIAIEDLAPGDLVFFNTLKQAFSHVGIYVGSGRFVHSPRAGERVRLEQLNANYWRQRFDGARRVLQTLSSAPTGSAATP